MKKLAIVLGLGSVGAIISMTGVWFVAGYITSSGAMLGMLIVALSGLWLFLLKRIEIECLEPTQAQFVRTNSKDNTSQST